jgi:hypothetical protein
MTFSTAQFVSHNAPHGLREQLHAYVERPLQRARDDGLWCEYQEALGAARTRREELRDALSSKIDAARASHRRRFKLRHHAIAAMPVAGTDKRKLYKILSFERRAAERKLGVKIKGWRTAGREAPLGSWKEFLAARASRGDQRAIRRLTRPLRGPAIKSADHHLGTLPSRASRTSRGGIVHNLPGGVRLRESAGAIELLGDSRDAALEQLAGLAGQRFRGRRVMRRPHDDPTVVGGAVPGGSVSLVISSMAPAGGSAKHANHGQVAA